MKRSINPKFEVGFHFLPAAEEAGCDASRAAAASQVLQDLSGHVGQQRRHHQQTVRRNSGPQGSVIPKRTFLVELFPHASGSEALRPTGLKVTSPLFSKAVQIKRGGRFNQRTVCCALGRLHKDGGEEVGRCDEGRCKLCEPLLSQPL